jgi:hypothetical protein
VTFPQYSDPGYFNSLPLVPPFAFQDMTTRVFPLRASLRSMQNTIDQYVNFIPPEVGRFKVVLPYTYLMMLDYGKLAVQVANLGWLSQHEVMFAIPCSWYKRRGSEWVYSGFVWITPFIWVDSDLALTLGRQVYGWPKQRMYLDATVPDWMNDPVAPVRKTTLSTAVFPKTYSGEPAVRRPFLEIDLDDTATMPRLPLNLEDPFAPWSLMRNGADLVRGGLMDFVGMLVGMGVAPQTTLSEPKAWLEMVLDYFASMNPRTPEINFNTLNLKQFRDAEYPADYCFQALTSAVMTVNGFNEAGLLGATGLWALDVTGGYRVRIHDWPSLPIIETLGLRVDKRWRGDGVDVAECRPVRPFWYNVDMAYERGQNLCWRSFDRTWHTPEGKRYRKPILPETDNAEEQIEEDQLYNSALGVNNGTVSGPYNFTDSTMRVLPLLANADVLELFIDEYLNEPLEGTDPALRFALWRDDAETPMDRKDCSATVYLVITDFGQVTSATDNIGDWAGQDAAFFVPVRLLKRNTTTNEEELDSVGLVPIFTYVSDTTSVIADTEVLGWPTTMGDFEMPEDPWLENPAPDAFKNLVRISAEVLPALAQGEGTVRRRIIEVNAGRRPLDVAADRIVEDWGQALRSDVRRKWLVREQVEQDRHEEIRRATRAQSAAASLSHLDTARAASLLTFQHSAPINIFTLKQFRDVHVPTKACYQSLLRIPRTIEHVIDFQEFEAPLHVRIAQYPSQQIVRLLGLKATLSVRQDGGEDYILFPVRPFWARLAWSEGDGDQICYRVGPEWQMRPDLDDIVELAKREDTDPVLPISVNLADVLDRGDPSLATAVRQAGDADPQVRGQRALLDSMLHAEGDPEAPATPQPAELFSEMPESPAERARRVAHWVEQRDTAWITWTAVSRALSELGPSTILDSLLSGEWAHASPTSRWRSRRQELQARILAARAGLTELHAITAQLRFLDELHAGSRNLAVLRHQPRLARELHAELILSREIARVLQSLLRATEGACLERVTDAPAAAREALQTRRRTIVDVVLAGFWEIARGSSTDSRFEDYICIVDDTGDGNNRSDLLALARGVEPLLALEAVLQKAAPPPRAEWPDEPVRHWLTQPGSWISALLRDVRQRFHSQLSRTLDTAARFAQKPDYCVNRGILGPDNTDQFPPAFSVEDLYVGPDGPESNLEERMDALIAELAHGGPSSSGGEGDGDSTTEDATMLADPDSVGPLFFSTEATDDDSASEP